MTLRWGSNGFCTTIGGWYVLCGLHSALRRVLIVVTVLLRHSSVVSLTLHAPIASMSHCMRICCARHLVVALHAPHIIHLHMTLMCMMQCSV